jgi:thiamine kinase-like enzyme
VKNRYNRGLQNKEAFCEVLESTDNFYSYKYTPGVLLSSKQSYHNTKSFLNFAQEYVWNKTGETSLSEECKSFYFNKTLSRLNLFNKKHGHYEESNLQINSLECLPVSNLLEFLTEKFYSSFEATSFHGDLHDDNILITDKSFKLIDWRESFDKNTQFGDKYYDLAKYLHTLEFNVHAMDNELYSINELSSKNYHINNDLSFNQLDATRAFFDHLTSFNYSKERVKIINALIYINMAPLYNGKLSEYLYFLGRYLLNQSYYNRGEQDEYFNRT